MRDMRAFERQVERTLQGAAGPSRPVDAEVIVRGFARRKALDRISSSTRRFRSTGPSDPAEGGFSMFSALKLAAAGIVLALFGGLLLAGGVFTPDGERLVPAAPSDVAADPTQTFPTGLFVATDRSDLHLEFLDDGTGHTILYPGSFEVWYTYAVNGDLWTEMTHASPLGSDRQVPATYFWEWDGELLSFEPWGEELNPNSRGATMAHDFRPIPDSRVVVVARTAIPAGGRIFSSRSDWGIVPVADTHPEALRSLQEVFGRTAAVAIGEGQTITPDLLEPAE